MKMVTFVTADVTKISLVSARCIASRGHKIPSFPAATPNLRHLNMQPPASFPVTAMVGAQIISTSCQSLWVSAGASNFASGRTGTVLGLEPYFQALHLVDGDETGSQSVSHSKSLFSFSSCHNGWRNVVASLPERETSVSSGTGRH